MVYAGLLRGINLAGKNKLPMAELVQMFEAAGCTDVRTYIQSGNVLFEAPAAVAKALPVEVPKLITSLFGYKVPVVVRSAAELHQLARANPFVTKNADFRKLGVAFLADRPSRKRASALDLDRSPPDRFELIGKDIYLEVPNGFARTKLGTDYFDRQLQTVSTLRNWKTVLKLCELSS